MIRIDLTHNSLGTITVIPDARGQAELEQTLKRSEENDGIVYEYALDLDFTKKSGAFLDQAYLVGGGIQSLVVASLFEWDPNQFRWDPIGTGKIKYSNHEKARLVFKTSIEQTGFEKKVVSQMDVDVDLDTTKSQAGITLPETPSVNITLHAKKVLEEFKARPSDSNEYQQLNVMRFSISGDPSESNVDREAIATGSIDTGDKLFDELDGAVVTTWGFLRNPNPDMGPGPRTISQYQTYLALPSIINSRSENYRAKNAGVANLKNKLTLKFKIEGVNTGGDIDTACPGGDVSGVIPYIEIHAWSEHRSADNVIKFIDHIGEWDMPGCTGDDVSEGIFQTFEYARPNVNISVGDKIYTYLTVRIHGTFDPPASSDGVVDYHVYVTAERCETYVNYISATTFPRSTAKGYMVFEFLKKIIQFYTDQEDCLRSTYFGRTDTDPAYPQDGPGSLELIVGGRAIRNGVLLESVTGDPEEPGDSCPDDEEDEDTPVTTNKTLFGKLQDAISSLRGIHCIGMGVERRDGKQVVVIEHISYFFNKEQLVLDLGVVSNHKRKPYIKDYATLIESGYPKLDIEKTNAIDEYNTLRRHKTPVTEVTAKDTNTSKYKTSGYEIESQRRLIGSTKDSKLDDATFIICVVRDSSEESGFRPERDENFAFVNNVYDPPSSYNLRLAPGRTLRNWGPVLASMVSRLSKKVFSFSYGEGNYFMQSRLIGETQTIDEKGDYDLSGIVPIWHNDIHTFDCPLNRDQMRIVRQYPYGYYIFRDYEGGPETHIFLMKVTRNAQKKLGSFEGLEVARII